MFLECISQNECFFTHIYLTNSIVCSDDYKTDTNHIVYLITAQIQSLVFDKRVERLRKIHRDVDLLSTSAFAGRIPYGVRHTSSNNRHRSL